MHHDDLVLLEDLAAASRPRLVQDDRVVIVGQDVVILDLTLPGGMGGKEALKKLIEIDPTVNAIVSSGYATDATMSRYQDFGFRGVIAKPYEATELGKIVHEVINASHVNFGGHIEDGRLATRVA